MEQLADGLWRWTARHPEWHPGEWGARVGCYAAQASDDHLVVVDPLLPRAEDGGDPDAVLEHLDGMPGRVTIAITIPYHVRDAEPLWRRWRRRGARIVGERRVARRLEDATGFEVLEPGSDGDVVAYAIGRPRRSELPLHLPSHDALVFGDALVVTPAGELRIWDNERASPERRRFYAVRFAPTLEPLVALGPQRILVTHGEPILSDGRAALEAAAAAGPWYRRG